MADEPLDWSELLTEIAGLREALSLSETRFGVLAVNDGKLIPRLRDGANMTYGTIRAVRKWMLQQWELLGQPGDQRCPTPAEQAA